MEEKKKAEELEKEKHEIGPTGAFFLICLFIIGTLVVARLTYYGIRYAPKQNHNPQEVYHIKGEFPFDEGYALYLDVSYATSNPECSRHSFITYINPTPIGMAWPIDVTQTGNNTFEATFAKDYYKPGGCKWRYAGVGYNISGGKYNLPTGSLGGLGGFPVNDRQVELLCKIRARELSKLLPNEKDLPKSYSISCWEQSEFIYNGSSDDVFISFNIQGE